MGMVRTVKCDLCNETVTEIDYGKGWPGWCIIQGIAATAPKDDIPLSTENTQMILCPEHKNMVSDYIQSIQIEKGLPT